jgi:hypothetical protein
MAPLHGAIAIGMAISVTAACGGGGEDAIDAGPVVLDPCGAGDPRSATIDVSQRSDVFHAGVYARIEAVVRDAIEPPLHAVVAEEGDCRYLRLEPGFCEPACGGGEQCTTGSECLPVPALVSGGTLTVTGVGEPIEIEPEDTSAGTYLGPTGLPAALFDETMVIGARLEGDDFPTVELRARGVAAIDTDLTASGFELPPGQDAEIMWTAGPDPDVCVEVVLNGFNEAHGAPLGDIVVCEGPDDGSLIVPQALADDFPIGETPDVTEGYDWPHSQLTRYTRSSQETALGTAALVVRSTAYFQLSHPAP